MLIPLLVSVVLTLKLVLDYLFGVVNVVLTDSRGSGVEPSLLLVHDHVVRASIGDRIVVVICVKDVIGVFREDRKFLETNTRVIWASGDDFIAVTNRIDHIFFVDIPLSAYVTLMVET